MKINILINQPTNEPNDSDLWDQVDIKSNITVYTFLQVVVVEWLWNGELKFLLAMYLIERFVE